MNDSVQTVLGFDFGERRIGVAVGQSVTSTATPLTILQSPHGRIDWPTIASTIEHWDPGLIIVGLPLNMDGSLQPFSARAQRFARQVQGRFGRSVVLYDERLTTREAARGSDRANRGRRASNRDGLDARAAALIVEGWFETPELAIAADVPVDSIYEQSPDC